MEAAPSLRIYLLWMDANWITAGQQMLAPYRHPSLPGGTSCHPQETFLSFEDFCSTSGVSEEKQNTEFSVKFQEATDTGLLISTSITSRHVVVIFLYKLLLSFLTIATGMLLSVYQNAITSSCPDVPAVESVRYRSVCLWNCSEASFSSAKGWISVTVWYVHFSQDQLDTLYWSFEFLSSADKVKALYATIPAKWTM